MLITGNKEQENWNVKESPVDFYDLKQIVEGLLKKLRIPTNSLRTATFSDSTFEFGLTYLLHQQPLIQLGQLTMATLKPFDIKKAVLYATIHWELLIQNIPQGTIKYEAVSKYPAVRRDLALVVDQQLRFETIEAIAFKTEPKLLQEVRIFDVYEGDKIPQGKKSYAVSFTLLDKENTLTDKVIDKTMQKLLNAFEQQTGAILR